MIHDYIDSLIGDPKYAIIGYEIVDDNAVLFASEITDAQAGIQKSIYGISISIVKTM